MDIWKYEGKEVDIIRRGDKYTYKIKKENLDYEKIKKIDIEKDQMNIFEFL